uniref:Uncharacterized protein n=1 Tax=Meloidogyne incognita TaxID=6306 RepID=A0A914NT20_MELIC
MNTSTFDGDFGYPREKKIDNMILNFGPNHPAAHGVLRLILKLEGEPVEEPLPLVTRSKTIFRGTNKLSGSRCSSTYFEIGGRGLVFLGVKGYGLVSDLKITFLEPIRTSLQFLIRKAPLPIPYFSRTFRSSPIPLE